MVDVAWNTAVGTVFAPTVAWVLRRELIEHDAVVELAPFTIIYDYTYTYYVISI